MFQIFIVSLIILTVVSLSTTSLYIVGGRDANIEDHPFQVALVKDSTKKFFCGGSLIGRNQVLTAAHCVISKVDSILHIRAGSSYLNENMVERLVEDIVIHPEYDIYSKDYDVAVLITHEPFHFSTNIQPIKLPDSDSLYKPKTEVSITGWGTVREGGDSTNRLQQAEVRIVRTRKCHEIFGSKLTSNMFCAGLLIGGIDSCQGDSGGPVVVNNIQLGITSWGYGCARPNYPGVYTKVSSVRSWIKAVAHV